MAKEIKVAMLSTGDEVLHGDILDSNSAWLGQQLLEHDLALSCRVTVGDNLSDLVEQMRRLSLEMDLVVVNGGLGPTSDDLSAEAMAKAASVPLLLNEEWQTHLESWFARTGRVMSSSNLKQAMLPEGASVIANPVGTACGFWLCLNRARFYFTPGVPSEFKKMITDEIIPLMKNHSGARSSVAIRRYTTVGLSESWLSDLLDPLSWPEGIVLGYRSALPIIELKLFAYGEVAMLDPAESQLLELIGDYVVAVGKHTQAQELIALLNEQHKQIALAESCTGGLVASQLVDIAGSSASFSYGLVCYSNEIKVQQLGVPAELIELQGVVSLPVAQAMAEGALRNSSADLALSFTGVAGPDGGDEQLPVGSVAIALACSDGSFAQMLHFSNRSRNQVRQLACAVGMDMARRYLQQRQVLAEYRFCRTVHTASTLSDKQVKLISGQ